MMKFLIPLALVGVLTTTGISQEAPPAVDLNSPEMRELVEGMFSSLEDEAEFKKAVAAAKKGGVPSQVILEARFVINNNDDDKSGLLALLEELEASVENYNDAESIIANSKDDWSGLVYYVKALKAKRDGADDAFRTNILEAVWSNPNQAALFAEVVAEYKDAQYLKDLKIPLDQKILDDTGKEITLASALGENKAILLDFWASWCGPCMALMPELQKKADHLKAHGIVVAGMNSEASPEVAKTVKESEKMNLTWLVEPEGEPLSKPLRIDSIPRMILLDKEGKVLFNGHPQEDGLWDALRKVDPAIKKPGEKTEAS